MKKKLNDAIAWATMVKKKSEQVMADVSKAVDDYKKLVEFREEVNEVSTYSYEYGFEDYKAKVKELFLDIDLKDVILPRHEEEEEEEEGKVAKEGEIQEERAVKEVTIEELSSCHPRRSSV